jgi:predicted transcriptional regulator
MPGGVAISENGNHCLAVDFDGFDYFELNSSIPLWQKNESDNIVRFFASPNITDIITYIYYWDSPPAIGYLNVYNATHSGAEKVWEKNFIETPCIESNGQYIALGSYLGNLSIYHKSSSHLLWSHDFGESMASLAMSLDGRYTVACTKSANCSIYLVNTTDSSNPVLWQFNFKLQDYLPLLALSNNGSFIAVGTYFGKLYLFNESSSTPRWQYDFPIEPDYGVTRLKFNADGSFLVASVGQYSHTNQNLENKVYLFDTSSSTPLGSFITKGRVSDLDISGESENIVVGDDSGYVYLLTTESIQAPECPEGSNPDLITMIIIIVLIFSFISITAVISLYLFMRKRYARSERIKNLSKIIPESSALTILGIHINESTFFKMIQKSNDIDPKLLHKIDFSRVSPKFLEKFEKVNLEAKKKVELFKEMTALSLKERNEIVDSLLKVEEQKEKLVEDKKLVYDVIKEYLNKNRSLNAEKIVSFIDSRFSKSSININRNEIMNILKDLMKQKYIIESSKLTKDDILLNSNRIAMYLHIKKNPGIHLKKIAKDLSLSLAVVDWHLQILMKFNFITKKKLENRDAYFDWNVDPSDKLLFYFLSKKRTQKIIEYLGSKPEGSILSHISTDLGMHLNTIRNYLKKLMEFELISIQKFNNSTLYFLNQINYDKLMNRLGEK